AVIEGEICVSFREARAAHPAALQPGRLDQAARMIAGRVLEDRARVRLPLRLTRDASGPHGVEPRTDCSGLLGPQAEAHGRDHEACRQVRAAGGEAQRVACETPRAAARAEAGAGS